MLSEALQQAQEAIVEGLREEKQAVSPKQILEKIREKRGLKDIDLREAVWLLIGRGEIELTSDRKLVSKACAHAQPTQDDSYASQSS